MRKRLMVVALGALALLPAQGAPAQAPPDPVRIALDYVRGQPQALGVARGDVAELVVASAYRSAHTGVTHVNLGQRHAGLEVFGAYATVNVTAGGEILFTGDSFVDGLAVASGAPDLDAPEAVEAAADGLGLDAPRNPRVVDRRGTETIVSPSGISDAPIPARQGWQPTKRGLRRAWQVTVDDDSSSHLWNATVDAETGKLLARDDWTDHDTAAGLGSALARPSGSAPHVGPPQRVRDGSSYSVFALPRESPNEGGRRTVFEPADAFGSPFGWHDVNGARGAEFTTTRGNNVHAYTDRDADDAPDPGSDPSGGRGLDFQFPLDLGEHAYHSSDAAVTNLFYWNNVIHDVAARYGFDAAAGNYQVNNYGRGGAGGDPVHAEAQDGSGDDNASFTTPAVDGTDEARMQMFLWTALEKGLPNAVTVTSGPAAGSYGAQFARFGPAPTTAGRSGRMVMAEPAQGCEPLVGFPARAIAVVDRGGCDFVVKARNAEAAGAVAVVIANDWGPPTSMAGPMDPPVRIPTVMVSQEDANAIKAGLPANARVHRNPRRPPIRDGDFDAAIVLHEYMHGISNRLTGGPTVNCLYGDEDMGEGWSDYLAIALLLDPALDHPEKARGMGTYAMFEGSRRDPGIRPAPYSRNMRLQPATYDSIKRAGWIEGATLAQPHGIGHVWGAILWDLTWDLIDRHGFNPNVYGRWDTGGNNLALQLVIDGLKMQGCAPGFVVARDAILAADEALTGGENQCTLWAAFARRGLGYGASQGWSLLRNDNFESFATHPDCRAGFSGGGISEGTALNRVHAGSTVPLRWAGRGGLAANSPFSRRVDCDTLAVKGPGPYITPRPLPEPTRTAHGWKPGHTYPWKTEREWAGTCREIVVTRENGVQHRAYFRFTPAAPVPEPPVRQRWLDRYDGFGDSEHAQSAVVSPDGTRVYVTGQSLGATTGYDYATVAYDAATGARVWTARFDGPLDTDGHDVAWALALSRDGSRLYVTGQSVGDGTFTDYATVAYDTATGRELWAARENGPSDGFDVARAVAVSPDGARVFVTGHHLNGDASLDYATAAYDARTGERLWLSAYNGPFPGGNSTDMANAVAVSPDGTRVFVTGQSSGVSSGDDYTTVAYDAASGRELWVGRYNGPANFFDTARAVAVSPDGAQVFVTGESPGGDLFNRDYATVAYDAADGRERWVARYDGPAAATDVARAIAVSPDGSGVFVTGSSVTGDATGLDYATVAYATGDGSRRWIARYNGPANDVDAAWALAVTSDGSRVLVTGQSLDVGTDWPDFATASYDAATGAERWAARYDGPGLGIDIPRAVGASPDGSRVFVAGESDGGETREDYATLAYDVTAAGR